LSVFYFIFGVMYTLLISCSPAYTPLISYCFSFYACSSHLILSLLSSSALILLHLVRSHLISYAFLTSNLFWHLCSSAVFSSHPPSSHFMFSHLFSFYLCHSLVLFIYTHFSSYYASFCISFLMFLCNIFSLHLFSSGLWHCVVQWVVTTVLEDVLPLYSLWKC
jgi:hypothetical protein